MTTFKYGDLVPDKATTVVKYNTSTCMMETVSLPYKDITPSLQRALSNLIERQMREYFEKAAADIFNSSAIPAEALPPPSSALMAVNRGFEDDGPHCFDYDTPTPMPALDAAVARVAEQRKNAPRDAATVSAIAAINWRSDGRPHRYEVD